MAKPFTSGTAIPEKGSYVQATLEAVRRCPARADFIELCFTTEAGPWKWCFPEPEERHAQSGADPLVLVLGRYGTQAHHIVDGGIGPALLSSEAMPMIIDGCQTLVARKMIEWGR
ncbi:hypothetical protein [Rhodococcus sp. IEGM 1307]|uniref:hypothetical protein n=1 Tax=Rhodococcus sp. IEGM 1307 TaxID=3047091 RepID=UPI0024B795C6|nr:hypothetical protein [Rhodococcus sp. IEGM 1307]MDI9979793.1 hypothetical protein [Rhodococcus sp. IEGM 1307]